MSKKVAVIGAGVLGLLSAIEAKKQGFEVEVFEKRDKNARKSLQNLLFLHGDTIEKLPNSTQAHIFSGEKPHAFITDKSYGFGDDRDECKRLRVDFAHTNVPIFELLEGLTAEANRLGIPIHYNHQYIKHEGHSPVFSITEAQRTCEADFSIDARGLGGSLYSNNPPTVLHTAPTVVAKFSADNAKFLDDGFRAEHPQTLIFPANIDAPYVGGITLSTRTTTVFRNLLPQELELYEGFESEDQKSAFLKGIINKFLMEIEAYAELGNYEHMTGEKFAAIRGGLVKCDYINRTDATCSVHTNPFDHETKTFVVGDALASAYYLLGGETNFHIKASLPILREALSQIKSGTDVALAGSEYTGRLNKSFFPSCEYLNFYLGEVGIPGSVLPNGQPVPNDYQRPSMSEVLDNAVGNAALGVKEDAQVGGAALQFSVGNSLTVPTTAPGGLRPPTAKPGGLRPPTARPGGPRPKGNG